MSTPLWHCSEISILPSGSGRAAACPSTAHQTEQQWARHWHPLLAPWKAVTWLSQHPTASHPSGGVMVDRGEPRPQTQSHGPEGPSCKSGHSFRIKFGRFAIAEHFLQLAKWSSTAHLPTCPPLQAQHWQSVPQHLLTQTGAGREGWKDHPCFKSFGLRHRMSAAEGGPSSSRDALGLLPPYHSRLQQGKEHWARGQDVNWTLSLPLKPALCSAGGAKHVMTPLNSHQRAAAIVAPQSLWAPSSKSAYASLLWKSLLEKNSVGFNQHRIRLSDDSHSEYAKYFKHYECHVFSQMKQLFMASLTPGHWFWDRMWSLMWTTVKDAGALSPPLTLHGFIWPQTCRHCRDSSFHSCSDTVPQPSRVGWSFLQGIPWSSHCYWCKSSPQHWHHPDLSPSAPHPRSQTAEGENPVMSPSQEESEPSNAEVELSWDKSET